MSLTRKIDVFTSDSVGSFAFARTRFPFRLFRKEPDTIHFRPAFAGAKWHKINLEVFDADHVLKLFGMTNAFAVMSYLRTNGILSD